MVAAANLVEVAALIGDTSRATMLAALMGGQSLTGSELAFLAHISRSTASEHLSRLVQAGLLSVTKKRRFHYYRIASPLVAQMMESMKVVAAIHVPPRYQPRSARDEALLFARTCYDHLAGRLGVALADALVAGGHVQLSEDGSMVTETGIELLSRLGVDVARHTPGKRIFCRACLDWSERRYHIAGFVGAELLRRSFELEWLSRIRDTRAVIITPAGRVGLHDVFGLKLEPA